MTPQPLKIDSHRTAAALLGRRLSDTRTERGLIGASELLRRASDAASFKLGGGIFSPDDRADCTAHILALVLADIRGDTGDTDRAVTATDRRATFGRMAGLAANYRKALLSRRTRELGDEQSVAAAQSLAPATAPERMIDGGGGGTLVQNLARAIDLLDAANIDADADTMAVALDYAADLPEGSATPAAAKKRLSRGRAKIRTAHPTAAALLAAIAASERERTPLDCSPILRAPLARTASHYPNGDAAADAVFTMGVDGSLPAETRRTDGGGSHPSDLPNDWREGTAGGERAQTPATAAAARAVCTVRHTAPQPPSPPRTPADAARRARDAATDRAQSSGEARRAVGRALRRPGDTR